jgi:hypothetical protein
MDFFHWRADLPCTMAEAEGDGGWYFSSAASIAASFANRSP